jgi:glycosyltransferase involved in cell wall biosynthesis
MEDSVRQTDRLAILQHNLVSGGCERMMINLATEWSKRGIAVDLVLVTREGAYLPLVPPEVRIVDLGAKRTLTAVAPLVRYLWRERPRAILSGLVHINTIALLAKAVAPGTRLVISERNTPSVDRKDRQPAARLGYRLAPYLYRRADAIIAVSAGVADDLSASTGLPRQRINVINNPVVTDQTLDLARKEFRHSWFEPGAPPVIVAAGRLAAAKDYPTLLRAFAKLRSTRSCRLMILGEGDLMNDLTRLARELGINRDVEFAGFVINPYAVMSRSALLVLSSRWEGSPNVLVEAMACGLPVVSTDCPSGPREILAGGKYGPLVPVGDVDALAAAMASTLEKPASRLLLEEGCRPYRSENSASRYLDAMLVGPTLLAPARMQRQA